MTASITDQLDRLCYDHIENGEPVNDDDLAWLIDTVDRLNRWIEHMPSHTYPEESRLWKSWALSAPIMPALTTRQVEA